MSKNKRPFTERELSVTKIFQNVTFDYVINQFSNMMNAAYFGLHDSDDKWGAVFKEWGMPIPPEEQSEDYWSEFGKNISQTPLNDFRKLGLLALSENLVDIPVQTTRHLALTGSLAYLMYDAFDFLRAGNNYDDPIPLRTVLNYRHTLAAVLLRNKDWKAGRFDFGDKKNPVFYLTKPVLERNPKRLWPEPRIDDTR